MGANATTSVPTYTAGQILEAADLNITNSGAPVFADSTARDAAFGGTGEKVLAEGQLAVLEDSNIVQLYDGSVWQTVGPSAGGVIQVKSTAKTDTFSTSSTSYTDVTGLSVAITPTSASNKVLIVAQLSVGGASTAAIGHFQLSGGNTSNYVGDTAGNRVRGVLGGFSNAAIQQVLFGMSIVYLDSPATTSATTYKVQARVPSGGGTAYINRSTLDSDDSNNIRGASSITVMEVAP